MHGSQLTLFGLRAYRLGEGERREDSLEEGKQSCLDMLYKV